MYTLDRHNSDTQNNDQNLNSGQIIYSTENATRWVHEKTNFLATLKNRHNSGIQYNSQNLNSGHIFDSTEIATKLVREQFRK